MTTDNETTHFGYEKIPVNQKIARVRAVFDRVADRYDLMNDLMSWGMHRLWKKMAIELAAPRSGQCVLDLAGGTGDLSQSLAKRVGSTGRVILADINCNMLRRARARLVDGGFVGNICYVQANAECLPFADHYFDRILIGFGLRNVTDQQAALTSMYRTLKPGGRCIILEFSTPTHDLLQKCYDFYSFSVIPLLGQWVAGDKASYQYLSESIRMHPDQNTLKNMMEKAGFIQCSFDNLLGGIVAIHQGLKQSC